MPAKLTLTVYREDNGSIITVEADPQEKIEVLKDVISIETSIPADQQILTFQSKEISSSSTPAQCGIQNNDVISLRKKISLPPNFFQQLQPSTQPQPPNSVPLFSPAPPPSTAVSNLDPRTMTPAQLQQHFRSNQNLLNQIIQTNPDLAEAVLHHDDSLMKEYMKHTQHNQASSQRMKQLEERLAINPFDIEAQKEIEEMIKKKNIEDSMEHAIEYMPESFAHVNMLYIDCQVNGTALKAFVDSGAQMTIMSKSCAQKCGLLRMVDERFKGVAVGVGSAAILGRIHVAQLSISKSFFPVSITVIDQQGLEFILGLDMLRRHQCSIDLKANVLRIGEEAVSFLSEKDIPKEFTAHRGSSTPQTPVSPLPFSSSSSTTQPQGQQNNNKASSNTAKAPAQAQPKPTAPSSTASVLSPATEEKIKQLMNFGFPRDKVIKALQLANGNVELAAGYLFQ